MTCKGKVGMQPENGALDIRCMANLEIWADRTELSATATELNKL